MSNEYPLWCIDTHEKTETQYRGPWETREPADAWVVAHADEYASATIRRCKRISAVGMVSADDVEERWNEQASENPEEWMWADWEDAVAELTNAKEAREAFDAWCEKYLKVHVFMCEPGESDS